MRKKKPRRGRPPGPRENVRSCLVVLRLTVAERSLIAGFANTEGVSVAEWMRKVCLEAVGLNHGE